MTTKEKIYLKTIDAKNKLARLNNKRDIISVTDNDIKQYCKSHTMNEMRAELEKAETLLEDEKRIITVKKYYATDKGKKLLQQLNSERNGLIERSNGIYTAFVKIIEQWITETLGGRWKPLYIGSESVIIQLYDKQGEAIAEHRFTVYSNDRVYFMRYGEIGDFNPLTDPDRQELLRGMAVFAQAKVAKQFRDMLLPLQTQLKQLEIEMEKVTHKINHPL